MTIASETNKSGPYNGNGATTAFGGGFKIADETHVQVIATDADGVETIKTLTTHYTIAGVGDPTFTVTMLVAPASGTKLTLIRNVPFTQELDLENQGAYYAEDVEAAFDAAAARDQQLKELVDRSVKIPASADVAELDDLIASVILLGDSASDLAALAAVSAEVVTLSAITADITTVAGISAAVTTVAGISAAVSAVAAVDTEITAIYTDLTALLAVPAAAAASASAASASASAAAASAAAAALFNPASYMATASYPTLVSLEGLTLVAGDILYATAADTLAKLAKGSSGQVLTQGASLPSWSTPVAGDRRNRWVNPAFQVSQENSNTLGTTNGYYPADQIAMYFTAATAAMSVQRVQARSIKGSKDQIEFKCTTAKAVLGASDFVTLTQNIEGQEIADLQWGTAGALPLVISAEVKLPAGLYHWHVQNSAGNRHIAVPFTVSAGEANTAVRKTVSVPGDTSGTWLTDTGIGATLDLVLAAGSSKTGGTLSTWGATAYLAQATQFNILSSTANVARLADVQAVADPDATGAAPPWELPDPVSEELRCFRYYYRETNENNTNEPIGNGAVINSTVFYMIQRFPAPMRIVPTLAVSNVADFQVFANATGFDTTNLAIADASSKTARITATSSGMTAGHAGYLRFDSTASRFIAFNARM